ncbi:Rrf2 family transcriptional regulator [Lentzea jiangxiensis]|uniref:Rrf2 family transcriptional regulator, nitric oxide-sensitive transcriptional repressor n=1 Tax=Lentzea jiangxiensis TaxID=641025 RepID=A0A1H0NIE1_9PSEU|nr:Rrf2 family transcriptional regulator [Lentzea jiangxiensis]SDO92328.1 Rrf2 family transcriptional regulator, nitric oxide-sensitive transcriptional repressor [Lentzea jiangxiensis]
MRLTKSTDIALRIVMRLAVSAEPANPTTREVAEVMGVQYTHAAKVVSQLQHLGVVVARRGRGGGLALAGTGRSTSVGWLVRELEGVGDVVDCEGEVSCPLSSACRLRRALRQAQEAFYASLDPLRVEDLVADPTGPVLLSLQLK